jgi:hypothetical protein
MDVLQIYYEACVNWIHQSNVYESTVVSCKTGNGVYIKYLAFSEWLSKLYLLNRALLHAVSTYNVRSLLAIMLSFVIPGLVNETMWVIISVTLPLKSLLLNYLIICSKCWNKYSLRVSFM